MARPDKAHRKARRATLGSHDRWSGEGRAFLLRERLASGAAEVSGADLGQMYIREALEVPITCKKLSDCFLIGIPSTRRRPTFQREVAGIVRVGQK